MTKSKTTKRALLSSCIALMLCFSMLLGTTYAWFTDEVTSSNNIIKSGILDVEMYYGDSAGAIDNDASAGAIFDYQYWEPGYTQVKYIKIANKGNLALRYTLTIVPDVQASGEYNLADVIDAYMLPVDADVSRAAIAAATPVGTLTDLMVNPEGAAHGIIIPKEDNRAPDFVLPTDPYKAESEEFVIVLKMKEEAGNEYQNLSVGDGFTVKLLATQYTAEKDSFDHLYDEFPPKATVNNQGAKTVKATIGIGGAVEEYELPFTLQFLPNETLEEAEASSYRYWHADYVVKADRDVSADSVALLGYYDAWCQYNNDNWVAMINEGTDIDADQEIRLVELLGATVNYEEICKYGNDPEDKLPDELEGFLCGAVDLTGANAGTTITVELRLYETTGDYTTDSGSKNEETGYYETVGTYSYTFPAVKVTNDEELADAINDGVTDIALTAGEYKMPSSGTTGTVNISGTKDTVLDMTMGAYLEGATVAIEGVTIKTSTGYANGNGSDYAALYTPDVTYTNCTFEGPMRVGRDGAKFVNCTFTELGNDYVWTYGNDVTFEGCTFNTDGKAILIYSDGGNEVAEVAVKDCVFTSTQGAKAYAIANQNCAAIEIHNYGNGVDLTTEGNTYDSNFSGEWRIKTYETGKTQIFVNGTEYTTIAIDGKTMTIDTERNVTVNE